jgi:hypothetical protein
MKASKSTTAPRAIATRCDTSDGRARPQLASCSRTLPHATCSGTAAPRRVSARRASGPRPNRTCGVRSPAAGTRQPRLTVSALRLRQVWDCKLRHPPQAARLLGGARVLALPAARSVRQARARRPAPM